MAKSNQRLAEATAVEVEERAPFLVGLAVEEMQGRCGGTRAAVELDLVVRDVVSGAEVGNGAPSRREEGLLLRQRQELVFATHTGEEERPLDLPFVQDPVGKERQSEVCDGGDTCTAVKLNSIQYRGNNVSTYG